MRTRTVVIGSSVALVVSGVVALVAPIEDVAPLVHHIAQGAPQDPHASEVLADAPAREARRRAKAPASAAPLRPTDEDRSPAALEADPLPAGAAPYVGTWTQESTTAAVTIRVTLTLADDGRYTGAAALHPPGAASDAPPSRTIGVAGVWSMQGPNVVLSRLESDGPGVLPVGWREVYWDSRVTGGDWVYTDADGLERRLIRRRAADRAPVRIKR